MNIQEVFQIIAGIFVRGDQQWLDLKERKYGWQVILIHITIPFLFLSSYAAVFSTPVELKFNLAPTSWFFVMFISNLLAILSSAGMIAALAPRFNGERSYDNVVTLLSLSYIPVFVATILGAFHPVFRVFSIAGLVLMIFLFLKGVRLMIGVPVHKQMGFAFISLILLFAVRVILLSIATAFALAITGTLYEVIPQV